MRANQFKYRLLLSVLATSAVLSFNVNQAQAAEIDGVAVTTSQEVVIAPQNETVTIEPVTSDAEVTTTPVEDTAAVEAVDVSDPTPVADIAPEAPEPVEADQMVEVVPTIEPLDSDTEDTPEIILEVPKVEAPVEATATVPVQQATIIRNDGYDREAVANKVAKTYFSTAKKVLVVNRDTFGDSISATNLSSSGYPILYTYHNKIKPETIAQMKAMPLNEVIALGGTKSIQENVLNQIRKEVNVPVRRISGSDRYAVNANAVKATVSKKDHVVMASGEIFTDALYGVSYANTIKAPILLAKKTVITDPVVQTLKDLGLKKVTLIGGQKTLTVAIENRLKALGITFNRISDTTRYSGSAQVATAAFVAPKTVIAVSGEVFTDALVSAPLAQKLNAPILLTYQNRLDPKVQTYLSTKKNTITTLIIQGGTKTITSNGQTLMKNALYKAPVPVKQPTASETEAAKKAAEAAAKKAADEAKKKAEAEAAKQVAEEAKKKAEAEAAKKAAEEAKKAAEQAVIKPATSKMILSDLYIQTMKPYVTATKGKYFDTLEKNIELDVNHEAVKATLKEEAVRLRKLNRDQYVFSGDKREFETNNIPEDINLELNLYAQEIRNDLKAQFGLEPVILSQGVMDFATQIAENAVRDKKTDTHNVPGITEAAREYGLNDKDNYYENLAIFGSLEKDNPVNGFENTLTVELAKAFIHESFNKFLFSNEIRPEFFHAQGTIYDPGYFAVSFSTYRKSLYIESPSVHFVTVKPSLIVNPSKFASKPITK